LATSTRHKWQDKIRIYYDVFPAQARYNGESAQKINFEMTMTPTDCLVKESSEGKITSSFRFIYLPPPKPRVMNKGYETGRKYDP